MSNHISHEPVAEKEDNLLVYVKILGICLTLLAIVLIAFFVFKVSLDTLFFGALLLACPLLHYWMMRGDHKH